MRPNPEQNIPQEIFTVLDSFDGMFWETNEYRSSTGGQTMWLKMASKMAADYDQFSKLITFG